MTDKEIIEACAEICGLRGGWHTATKVKQHAHFVYDPGDGYESLLTFNPLADANDAWRVLEAVRENPTTYLKLVPSMCEKFNTTLDTSLALSRWFWQGHFSDIARAAANAWASCKAEQKG